MNTKTKPMTVPPATIPNPAYGASVDELNYQRPVAIMARIRPEYEERCLCCEVDIADGGCAVGLYVDPRYGLGPHMALAADVLCPWCADLPDQELAAGILAAFLRVMKDSQASAEKAIQANAEGRCHVWDIEAAAIEARAGLALAGAMEGLLLRPGEEWTPTSHPKQARKKEIARASA